MTLSEWTVTLFVTGDAPRSRRARANLARALGYVNPDAPTVIEVDLLAAPQSALDNGIFASPALMMTPADGESSVMYGDLSDMERLMQFLGVYRTDKP